MGQFDFVHFFKKNIRSSSLLINGGRRLHPSSLTKTSPPQLEIESGSTLSAARMITYNPRVPHLEENRKVVRRNPKEEKTDEGGC